MVIYLERGADGLHMVQLMPLHPQTLSSFASFKSRLFLPFWYLPTRVVLEKRSLNGCSSNRLAGLWFDSQEHLMQKYLRSDTLHALCPFLPHQSWDPVCKYLTIYNKNKVCRKVDL